MSNRSDGTRFEQELCDILKEYGFWSYNVAQNRTGQPADVIATKNNRPCLIDCKVCKNNRFVLSRIESNQHGAMDRWRKTGNTKCYFAIKLADESIYFIYWGTLKSYMLSGYSSLNEEDIRHQLTLEEWVGYYDAN